MKSVEGLHVLVHTKVEEHILDAIIAAEPAVIQLRDKEATLEEIEKGGRILKQKLNGSDTLLFVNDSIPIAVAIGADGVHLGQSDMNQEELRMLQERYMYFGESVATISQAQIAQNRGAKYVGITVGSSIVTKPDAVPLGLESLSLISDAIEIPVIGIGGINVRNAHIVLQHGARGLAVAGEVIRSSHPRESALELNKIIYQCRKR